jgi:hypothetical protein
MSESVQKEQDDDPTLRQQWEKFYKCSKQQGYLYKGKALVVLKDQNLRKKILKQYHDGPTAGHPGV